MIQVVHRVDASLESELRRFLAATPAEAGACFEHDPRWLQVLEEGLGHQPVALIARDEDHVSDDGDRSASAPSPIRGYLPLARVSSRLFGRYLVSLPYLNRAGLVAVDADVGNELLDAAIALADRHDARYLELRCHAHVLTHHRLRERRDDKVILRMTLPADEDQLWKQLSSKVRNQIRKGDKAELSIQWGATDLLDDFHRVFSINMRDLGTPVYPRRLFERILTRLNEEAELAVVRCGGRPIAGALLIHEPFGQPRATQVPSASCLRAYNSTNANMWMYHRLLVRAIQRGSGVFDFGRSSPDSGTFRFKRQWGAEPSPTTWQYHLRRGEVGSLRPDHPRMQRRVATWQKLPVWVTRMVGPAIIRGIP